MARGIFRKNCRTGFTLVEVIAVCAIIGIAASIAAPNFMNAFQKMQVRDIVSSARWAEDAIMSLTGLQYANTQAGNPLLLPWPAEADIQQSEASKDYISVEYGKEGHLNTFRAAPANIAETGARRVSAGLAEFYKRTMNDLPPVDWRPGYERNIPCSVYFLLDASNISQDISHVEPAGSFVQYRFCYSEYFTTKGDRRLAVYHGIRFHGSGAKTGTAAASAPTADAGWHVYDMTDGAMVYYGSIEGTN